MLNIPTQIPTPSPLHPISTPSISLFLE
jgi:hypothetical protein